MTKVNMYMNKTGMADPFQKHEKINTTKPKMARIKQKFDMFKQETFSFALLIPFSAEKEKKRNK